MPIGADRAVTYVFLWTQLEFFPLGEEQLAGTLVGFREYKHLAVDGLADAAGRPNAYRRS
jgi:hypothetical protein